ncbi:hypothetical protein AVEN_33778-1, partial [Araneus ventricosus]
SVPVLGRLLVARRNRRSARKHGLRQSRDIPREGPDAGPGRTGLTRPSQSRPVPVQCHTRFGSQPDGPSPQSQSLTRSYGSNLPTSLIYIVQSTRGCLPWRPAADTGTDRHANHTPSLGFARADRGARDTTRAAVLLRRQRPYLRTSRFQGHESLQRKDNSSPGPPSTSPSSVALLHLSPSGLFPCPG